MDVACIRLNLPALLLRFYLRPFVYIFFLSLFSLVMSPVQAKEGSTFPDSFGLELHLGAEDGKLLSGFLGLNEDLFVTSRVPQLGTPGNPVLANLIWQLYTVSGEPIPEFNKTRQIAGRGNEEQCSFHIRASELANGMYFVALTHQFAFDPTRFYQASEPFEVKQPLAIKEVVIDESPKGKTSQHIFYEDQSPHIFVYYYLADDVYTALVQIDVIDERGKVRASRTIFKDKDFSRKRERVGIKLPPALFKAGEKARVVVEVTTPDDTKVSAESSFEILAIDLGINLPDVMVQGTVADFQLFVPQTFNGPFSTEFKHIDGFIFKPDEGGVTGKLFVTPVAETASHDVEISVVDSLGNRASGSITIEVKQGALRYNRRPKTTSQTPGKSGGRIGSSTRR